MLCSKSQPPPPRSSHLITHGRSGGSRRARRVNVSSRRGVRARALRGCVLSGPGEIWALQVSGRYFDGRWGGWVQEGEGDRASKLGEFGRLGIMGWDGNFSFSPWPLDFRPFLLTSGWLRGRVRRWIVGVVFWVGKGKGCVHRFGWGGERVVYPHMRW